MVRLGVAKDQGWGSGRDKGLTTSGENAGEGRWTLGPRSSGNGAGEGFLELNARTVKEDGNGEKACACATRKSPGTGRRSHAWGLRAAGCWWQPGFGGDIWEVVEVRGSQQRGQ